MIRILGLFLLLYTQTAWAITLEWTPDPEWNIIGVHIYWDNNASDEVYMVDILQPVNSGTIDDVNFIPDTIYYFWATAFDANSESVESNTVMAYLDENGVWDPPLQESNRHHSTCFIESSR